MKHADICPMCGSELADVGSNLNLEEPYPTVVLRHGIRSLTDIGDEATRLKEQGQLTPQAYRRLVFDAIEAHSYHLENWVRLSVGWNKPFCPLQFPSFECTSYEMQELYWSLNGTILGLGQNVQEVRGKLDQWYVEYRHGSTFMRIAARERSLDVFLQVSERDFTDPLGWTAKVSNLGEFNAVFRLDPSKQLDYAMSLIKQAYDYTVQNGTR
jgi:predicted transport protein